MYTRCVEDEVGIEITSLEIDQNGEIVVEFGEGYTDEGAARVVSVCAARIAGIFEPGGPSVLGPPPNLGRPGTAADLEQLLDSRAKLGFEGAALVESDGVVRVSAGYGSLSVDDARAPDADTAFDCGSIMKEVTAATIFLLEEDGLLSRDETLGELLPDTPEVWRSVTLNQLLSHQAGFEPYHDTEGDFEEMDRDTALRLILEQEPLFQPGSDTSYSNSGYTLLAIVIEEVAAEPYGDFIRERIFDPLGMDRSGLYADARWQDRNVAVGRGAALHDGNDPSRWPAPTWALLGNGGLVSTLSDLLKLAKAFAGDDLFQPETRQAFRAFSEQETSASVAGIPLTGYAGGNDFGFNVLVGQVPDDATYVLTASHVLSPVTAEILGVELLQVIYGEPLVASP
jgi:CubicO group peptidase (beta-lactamase class C family)